MLQTFQMTLVHNISFKLDENLFLANISLLFCKKLLFVVGILFSVYCFHVVRPSVRPSVRNVLFP